MSAKEKVRMQIIQAQRVLLYVFCAGFGFFLSFHTRKCIKNLVFDAIYDIIYPYVFKKL